MDKYKNRYLILKILLLTVLIGLLALAFIGPDIGETFDVGSCMP